MEFAEQNNSNKNTDDSIFIIVYYLPLEWNHIISAIIFAVAALTDWVDGFIARKYDMVTKFGEFLDPLADKLIVVAALALP